MLKINGEQFVDPSGHPVKFWGVNLVACYPLHSRADALAENLADLQINLVRPHHDLRPSGDWNPGMVSGALLRYRDNSREFDTEALDRFDYLNAALRKKGIYLALSTHWTRRYLPGDVDILKKDDKDNAAWRAALKELDGWGWKMNFEVYKMLPSIDERAALIDVEFVKNFLTHVNPYTGVAYGADPQVLTIEVRNEASFEYGIICGAHFPAYMQAELTRRWNAYAAEEGIQPGDIYKPADEKARSVRGKFLKKLDEDYFNRIKAAVRATGCKAAITYSNLWRGDNVLEMHSRLSDQIENHNYMNPLVTGTAVDGFYELGKTALAGKPYFVGELNQGEGEALTRQQAPTRTMLPIASAAFGSLQNWSGFVWFAWMHGDSKMGEDGWGLNENRAAALGGMMEDGMMIDHLRTAGMIFRRGLVAKAKETMVMNVDEPLAVGNYRALMQGKYNYSPGWQWVHEMRKSFGAVPPEQATAPWMTQPPVSPVASDTGEIVKDNDRRQLSVSAPQTEAFSGFLDGKAPAKLQCLGIEGEGFATVILVANDSKSLGTSESLIISKTGLNANNVETNGPKVRLRGLKTPSADQHWYISLTRPRAAAALMKEFEGSADRRLENAADGSLELPLASWHECELSLHK